MKLQNRAHLLNSIYRSNILYGHTLQYIYIFLSTPYRKWTYLFDSHTFLLLLKFVVGHFIVWRAETACSHTQRRPSQDNSHTHRECIRKTNRCGTNTYTPRAAAVATTTVTQFQKSKHTHYAWCEREREQNRPFCQSIWSKSNVGHSTSERQTETSSDCE